jgi:hypothetical protein
MTSTQPEGAVLAWLGADPVSFSRVKAALAAVKIETYEADEHNHLMRMPSGPPRYAIFVHAKDVSRAAEVIRETGAPPG